MHKNDDFNFGLIFQKLHESYDSNRSLSLLFASFPHSITIPFVSVNSGVLLALGGHGSTFTGPLWGDNTMGEFCEGKKKKSKTSTRHECIIYRGRGQTNEMKAATMWQRREKKKSRNNRRDNTRLCLRLCKCALVCGSSVSLVPTRSPLVSE